VSAIYQNPQIDIQQLKREELYNKHVSLVIRVKHHPGGASWGILTYKLKGKWEWIGISSMIPLSDPRFYDYVIPLGNNISLDNEPLEKLEVKWISLYRYP